MENGLKLEKTSLETVCVFKKLPKIKYKQLFLQLNVIPSQRQFPGMLCVDLTALI